MSLIFAWSENIVVWQYDSFIFYSKCPSRNTEENQIFWLKTTFFCLDSNRLSIAFCTKSQGHCVQISILLKILCQDSKAGVPQTEEQAEGSISLYFWPWGSVSGRSEVGLVSTLSRGEMPLWRLRWMGLTSRGWRHLQDQSPTQTTWPVLGWSRTSREAWDMGGGISRWGDRREALL